MVERLIEHIKTEHNVPEQRGVISTMVEHNTAEQEGVTSLRV